MAVAGEVLPKRKLHLQIQTSACSLSKHNAFVRYKKNVVFNVSRALKYLHLLAKEVFSHPGDESDSQEGANSDGTHSEPGHKGLRESKGTVEVLLEVLHHSPPRTRQSQVNCSSHGRHRHSQLWSLVSQCDVITTTIIL